MSKILDVLDERHLELQAGFALDAHRVAELQDQRLLGLANGECRTQHHDQQHGGDDGGGDEGPFVHRGASCWRRCISGRGKYGTTPEPPLPVGSMITFCVFFRRLLHPLQVKPPCGDVAARLIGFQHRDEALRLTFCLARQLLAIRLGALCDPLGFTLGARHDVVAIGGRFVHRTLLVLPGALHIVESVDYLAWRIDLQLLDLGDEDAGVIAIENLLQQFLRSVVDLLPLQRQRVFEERLTHDFADRTFRRQLSPFPLDRGC